MNLFISRCKAMPGTTALTVLAGILFAVARIGNSLTIAEAVNAIAVDRSGDITMLIVRCLAFIALVPLGQYVWLRANALWDYKLRLHIEGRIAAYYTRYAANSSEAQNWFARESETLQAEYFNVILQGFIQAVQFVIAIGIGFYHSWMIASFVIMSFALSMLVSSLFSKRLAQKTEEVQTENRRLLAVINGIVLSVTDLKVFLSGKFGFSTATRAIDERQRKTLGLNAYRGKVFSVNTAFSVLTQTGAGVLGLLLVRGGAADFASVYSVIMVLQYMTAPIVFFVEMKNQADSTKGIRDRLAALESADCTLPENVKSGYSIESISLNGVSYSYDGAKQALSDITLNIEKGKKYLVLGRSGSGKSTLLKILIRNLSAYSGGVFVNGRPISELSDSDYFHKMGYIGQNSHLLPISLARNIALNDNYDDGRVRGALGYVKLSAKPPELSVAEDGQNLSGGEYQRVLIARLMYHNKDFFLLDEFSASLDPVNALELERAVLSVENSTLVNVTHKINPELLPLYDGIIMLRGGQMVYCGSASIPADELAAMYGE